MKTSCFALAAALLGLLSAPAARADQALASALEKVSKEQIAAFNREDAAATLSYAHTKSPTYDPAREALAAQFGELDAKAEQVSFQYIGHDDEFAVARVKVKVTAPTRMSASRVRIDAVHSAQPSGLHPQPWNTPVSSTIARSCSAPIK